MKILKISLFSLVIIILLGGVLIFSNKPTNPTVSKIIIDPSSIITDPKLVESTISNLKSPISVIDLPDQENLQQYRSLPYYFAQPNALIVGDKSKFMKDLGYAVTFNVLSSRYSKYMTTEKPTFLVLPEGTFSSKYRELQIQRFQSQKRELQRQMDANTKILESAKTSLAYDSAQLANLEQQVATARKQQLVYITEQNQIIKSFSDPTSHNYRKSELITGAFVPPSTIMFREPVHSDKNAALDDLNQLVRTIIHESLHYYANAESRVYLSPFFYEAFTEYLTLKALGYQDDSMYLYSGYPLHTQVMTLIANKIPLGTLEKINFTQDGTLFESTFRQYFPLTDYDSFMQLTENIDSLWFSSSAKPNEEYKDHQYVLQISKLLDK